MATNDRRFNARFGISVGNTAFADGQSLEVVDQLGLMNLEALSGTHKINVDQLTINAASGEVITRGNVTAGLGGTGVFSAVGGGGKYQINAIDVLTSNIALGSATTITIGGNNTTSVAIGTNGSTLETVTIGGAISGNVLTLNGVFSGQTSLRSSITSGTQNLFDGITTGNLSVGSSSAGKVTINFASPNTLGTTASGALQLTGTSAGLGVAGNATFGGDVRIKGGDLEIEGLPTIRGITTSSVVGLFDTTTVAITIGSAAPVFISGSTTTPLIIGQTASSGILTLRANSTDLTTGYVANISTADVTLGTVASGSTRLSGGLSVAKSLHVEANARFVGGNITFGASPALLALNTPNTVSLFSTTTGNIVFGGAASSITVAGNIAAAASGTTINLFASSISTINLGGAASNVVLGGTMEFTAAPVIASTTPSNNASIFGTSTGNISLGATASKVIISGTTDSTSSTTGALQVVGGVGIGKTVVIAGNGTITSSNPIITATQTWNSGAVKFEALKLNVTSTASAATSTLLNLQVGGVDAFTVNKSGRIDAGIIPWLSVESDVAATDVAPSVYLSGPKGLHYDAKDAAAIPIPEGAAEDVQGLITMYPQGTGAQHDVLQLATTRKGNLFLRTNTNTTTWEPVWKKILFEPLTTSLNTSTSITVYGLGYSGLPNTEWLHLGHDGFNAFVDSRQTGAGLVENLLLQRGGTTYITLAANNALMGKSLEFIAGTTSAPSFRIPSGVAPTAPVAGDLWNAGGNIQYAHGGTTRELLWQDPAGTSALANILTKSIEVTGNNSTTTNWGLVGIGIKATPTSYTNSSAGGVPSMAIHALARPTIVSASVVTYSNIATFYIDGAPIAGGNSTITNAYNIWSAAGTNRFDGPVVLAAGSVSSPSLSLETSRNTGIYFPATDTIAFGTSGTENFRCSGNYALFGNASPIVGSVYTPNVQMTGEAIVKASLSLNYFASNAIAPLLVFTKNKGTIAAPSNVAASDELMVIAAEGYGVGANRRAGELVFIAAGSGTANGVDTTFNVRLSTGSTTPANRLTITSNGDTTPTLTTQKLGTSANKWNEVNTVWTVVNDGSAHTSATVTTASTVTTDLITLPVATYRSAKFVVSATQSTNVMTSDILAIHNGTTADHTEFGRVTMGAIDPLFTVDVSGGNMRLRVTSSVATSTKYMVTVIANRV